MNDVKVVIELAKAAVGLGFGYPLIFAGMQESAVPYKEVGSLDEIIAAGFTAESEVYKAAELLFSQNDAPGKIAVCASTDTAITALPAIMNEGWRQLVVTSLNDTGESAIEAIANYIEKADKHAMFVASVDPVSDAGAIQAIADNKRTILIAYTTNDVGTPEAALVGATAGLEVGSYTYKNIILKGVTPQNYSEIEVKELHEKGVITILKKAGSLVTSEGIVVNGEFADIVDAEDYIIEQIEYECQTLMNRVPKLAYDNRGIAALEGVVLSVLVDAANNGMIAVDDEGNYMYSVTFKPRSECDPVDISARHYTEGSFEFSLAGAIHTAKIKGTIVA